MATYTIKLQVYPNNGSSYYTLQQSGVHEGEWVTWNLSAPTPPTGKYFDYWLIDGSYQTSSTVSFTPDVSSGTTQTHSANAYYNTYYNIGYNIRYSANGTTTPYYSIREESKTSTQVYTLDEDSSIANSLRPSTATSTWIFSGWTPSSVTLQQPSGKVYPSITATGRWYDPSPTYTAIIYYDSGTVDPVGNMPTSSGGTSSTTSVQIQLSNQIPTRSNYTFSGWAINGSIYPAGGTVTVTGSTSGKSYTATAQWTYTPPTYNVFREINYYRNGKLISSATRTIWLYQQSSETVSNVDPDPQPTVADNRSYNPEPTIQESVYDIYTWSGWFPATTTLYSTSHAAEKVYGQWNHAVGGTALYYYKLGSGSLIPLTDGQGQQYSESYNTSTSTETSTYSLQRVPTVQSTITDGTGKTYTFSSWNASSIILRGYQNNGYFPSYNIIAQYEQSTYDIGIRLRYSANGSYYPSSGTITEERLDQASDELTINTPDSHGSITSIKEKLKPQTSYQEDTWEFSGWEPSQITLKEKDKDIGLYPFELVIGSWTRELKATLNFEASGEDITNIPSPISKTVRSEDDHKNITFTIPHGPTRSAWTFDKWVKGSNQYSPGDSYSFNAAPVSIDDGSHDTLSATWKNYNPAITTFSLTTPQKGKLQLKYTLKANTKWVSYNIYFYDEDGNLRKTVSRTSSLKTKTETLNVNDLSFEFYRVVVSVSFNGSGSIVTRQSSKEITFTSYSQLYVYATKNGITKWWIAVPYVYDNGWHEAIPYIYTNGGWNPPT